MYYLIYVSSATKLLDEAQLTKILQESRENNLEKDITGILIYMDGSIIQLLEGEEEAVNQVYDKILLDGRHTGIIKIKDGSTEDRRFPDWSMGFKSVSEEEYENLVGYRNTKEANFKKNFKNISDHPAMIILNSFIKNNRI